MSVVWVVLLVNPGGDVRVFETWSSLSVNLSLGSSIMSISTPNYGDSVSAVRDYESDFVALRCHIDDDMASHIMSTDAIIRGRTLGPTDHVGQDGDSTVDIPCVDYAGMLRSRLLHQADLGSSYVPVGGGASVPARIYSGQGQFNIAMDLINLTQGKPSGPLVHGVTSVTYATSGANTLRDRTYDRVGMSIYEAIDNIAAVDGGYDWWSDIPNTPPYLPVIHFANPRRERDRTGDFELVYSVQVAEVDRNPVSGFANVAIVTGAEGVPAQSHARLVGSPDPRGRWERAWDQSSVITTATLAEYATYYTDYLARNLPSYNLKITTPDWFDNDMQLGDVVRFRVSFPPRMDIITRVRITEAQIEVSPDGGEEVSCVALADDDELRVMGGRTQTGTSRVGSVRELGQFLAVVAEKLRL